MKSILDALFYTLANFWLTGVRFLVNLVVRTFVAPAVFGAASFAQGVQGYLGAYNGVYRNAIDRELPLARASRDQAEERRILRASYTLLVGSLVVESAALGLVALLVADAYLRWAFVAFAFANLFDSVAMADRITLKASERFRDLALASFWLGPLAAVLLLASSWLWGDRGYFAGLAASALAGFLVCRGALGGGLRRDLSLRVERHDVRRVLGVGLGIAVFGLARQALGTVDRFLVAGLLGLTNLGYYSLGTAFVVNLGLLAQSIAGSYFPKLVGHLGAGRPDRAADASRRLQAAVVLASTTAFLALAWILRPLVEALYPDYRAAVPALEVMVLGGALLGAANVPQQVLIAAGRAWRATAITLGATAAAVVLDLALVGRGLIGVALGTSIAFAVYALALAASARRVVRARGLVTWTLACSALVIGFAAVLVAAGRVAAAVYVVALAVGGAVHVTRLLGIDWRRRPAAARAYLAPRGPSGSGKGGR